MKRCSRLNAAPCQLCLGVRRSGRGLLSILLAHDAVGLVQIGLGVAAGLLLASGAAAFFGLRGAAAASRDGPGVQLLASRRISVIPPGA